VTRWRWSIVGLVGAVLFVDSVFYAAIVPILGRLSRELDLSRGQAGVLVGAYAGGMVLAAYPAARFVVRWGGRASVVVGLSGMSLACLVFGFADSFALLLIARILQGVGGALSWTGGLAWLADSTPRHRRGRMLGTALGAGVFGTQLGPVLGVLAAAIGRGPAFASGALVGGALAAWALTTQPGVASIGARTGGARALAGREFNAGFWLTALPSACLGIIDVLAPLRLSALGRTPFEIGAIFFLAAGLLAVSSRITGHAIDATGISWPILIALAGSIGSLAVLAVADGTLSLALVVPIGSACLGSLWGPGMYLLSSAARKAEVDEGYAFGAFLFAWAVGFAAGSSASGVLAGAFGEPATYLGALVVCLLPATAFARQGTTAGDEPAAAADTRPDTAIASQRLVGERSIEAGSDRRVS
jgi:MFS family permease